MSCTLRFLHADGYVRIFELDDCRLEDSTKTIEGIAEDYLESMWVEDIRHVLPIRWQMFRNGLLLKTGTVDCNAKVVISHDGKEN